MPSNQSTWVFVWTSMPVGPFKRETEGWLLQGRPNTYPERGWVVAHDVFHHEPGDTGTYAQEVSTFGAELWMDSQTPLSDLSEKIEDSWTGVMAMVLENGTRGVRGLLLKETPDPSLLNHDFAPFFRQAYKGALENVRRDFVEFSEDSAWDMVAAPEMVDRAAALAVDGFDRAAKRWPNVPQAVTWFKQLETMAEKRGKPGEVLTVSVQDGEMRIERQAPKPAPGSVGSKASIRRQAI